MAMELRPEAKELLSQRGYDPVLGPGRCAGRSSGDRDSLSEKILFGELRRPDRRRGGGGSGETATFTFKGEPKPDDLPDVPVS